MTSHKEEYDENYFENGEEKGISCYSNYHWIPERTLVTASEIIRKSHIEKIDAILDFGCAKGYLVKALRHLGYKSFGTDISKYALEKADEEVMGYLVNTNEYSFRKKEFDVIICKDTAEHISNKQIDGFLKKISFITKKKAIFIIPLGNGKRYNIPRYELDVTHKIKQSFGWWVKKIEDCGFNVISATDDLRDIKPNWNVPLANIYIEAIPK